MSRERERDARNGRTAHPAALMMRCAYLIGHEEGSHGPSKPRRKLKHRNTLDTPVQNSR